MERQRDEDAKESTICHSTRSLPPAQDRLPGPGGCSAAGCYPPGLWLWPAPSHHPLTLRNVELEVLAGSECTGFNPMPRATLLTAHHCPWPRAQGEPVRAGGHLCCSVARRTALSPSNLYSVLLSLQFACSSPAAQLGLISRCIGTLPGPVSSHRLGTAVC